MNKTNYVIFSLFLFMIAICNIKAEDNLVNLYLFYSKTCPHCEEEIKMLDSIKDDYKNLRIYKYELSEDNNSEIFKKIRERNFDVCNKCEYNKYCGGCRVRALYKGNLYGEDSYCWKLK